jgi:undecaprenyl diphosphate synthase
MKSVKTLLFIAPVWVEVLDPVCIFDRELETPAGWSIFLMDLIVEYLRKITWNEGKRVRLHFIGMSKDFEKSTRQSVIPRWRRGQPWIEVNNAINYGEEQNSFVDPQLIRVCSAESDGRWLTDERFSSYCIHQGPDPELIIRSGVETRLSNFWFGRPICGIVFYRRHARVRRKTVRLRQWILPKEK